MNKKTLWLMLAGCTGTFEINLSGEGEANPAGDWLGPFFPAKGWKKVKTATP